MAFEGPKPAGFEQKKKLEKPEDLIQVGEITADQLGEKAIGELQEAIRAGHEERGREEMAKALEKAVRELEGLKD